MSFSFNMLDVPSMYPRCLWYKLMYKEEGEGNPQGKKKGSIIYLNDT